MQSAELQSYHTMTGSEKPSRDADYLRWRSRVGAALLKAGMGAEYDLWNGCSDPASFFCPDHSGDLPAGVIGVNTCSHNPEHQATAVCPTCQLRYCPDCCHRQTARLLNRYMPFLRGLVADSDELLALRHIVLTTPVDLRHSDCRVQVVELCKKLVACFDQLLGAGWRETCGLLFAYEFGESGLKLHFHCLVYCPYIDQEDLADAWRDVTGGMCEVVFIALITENPDEGQSLEDAVAEVLKYAAKLWKRTKDGKVSYLEPDLVPLLAKVMKGTRRVRSYGIFYKLEVEELPSVCETCAAAVVRLSPVEWEIWCNTGFMPLEFKYVVEGGEGLNLILGNNFLHDAAGIKPDPALNQPEMPGFESFDLEKVRHMFGLGGKK